MRTCARRSPGVCSRATPQARCAWARRSLASGDGRTAGPRGASFSSRRWRLGPKVRRTTWLVSSPLPGGFAFAQGDNSGAVSLLAQGLTLPRTAETRPWVLRIVLKLAQAFGQLRDFTEAMRHYEALQLASEENDWRTLLEVRWSMAYTATFQGALERARDLAEAVLIDERSAGEPLMVAGTKELLAWIALAANDLDRASDLLQEARVVAERAPSWPMGCAPTSRSTGPCWPIDRATLNAPGSILPRCFLGAERQCPARAGVLAAHPRQHRRSPRPNG